MDSRSIVICIVLAIITTNMIRVVPMLLIRGEISNRYVRSFLYYVPYVTLAVMTFPSIIQTTMSPLSGVVALAVGIVAAWRRLELFPVADICCTIVYLMDSVIK